MDRKIIKYLNGTVNPEEFSEVVKDLCEEKNSEVSIELLEFWKETLSVETETKENSQLLEKIHNRIQIEESKVITRRFVLYSKLLKVAAVLIIGLLISTIAFYYQTRESQNAALSQSITTPFGARTNFVLHDGSQVWLNSGSTITFPQQFGDVRNVELSGEAFFKVAKDGRPFIVNTGLGKVKVLGTSFDVKAYPDESFETTLVEGKVNVSDRADHYAMLMPGQQSIITSFDMFTIHQVNTGLKTSWRDGKLIFVNEPFEHVVKELERWYNVKIELDGAKLKKLGYTGTIEMETFSEVLELINTTAPIKSIFDKKSRVLKIWER